MASVMLGRIKFLRLIEFPGYIHTINTCSHISASQLIQCSFASESNPSPVLRRKFLNQRQRNQKKLKPNKPVSAALMISIVLIAISFFHLLRDLLIKRMTHLSSLKESQV